MGAPVGPRKGLSRLRRLRPTGMVLVFVLLVIALADCRLRMPVRPYADTVAVRLGTPGSQPKATNYTYFPPSVRVVDATSKYIDREMVPEVLPSLASALTSGGVASALLVGCAGAPLLAGAFNTAGIKVRARPSASQRRRSRVALGSPRLPAPRAPPRKPRAWRCADPWPCVKQGSARAPRPRRNPARPPASTRPQTPSRLPAARARAPWLSCSYAQCGRRRRPPRWRSSSSSQRAAPTSRLMGSCTLTTPRRRVRCWCAPSGGAARAAAAVSPASAAA